MKKVNTKTVEETFDFNKELNNSFEVSDSNFKNYKIKMLLENADPDAIVLDGFNDALIGTTSDGRLVYDIGIMRKVLIKRDKMEIFDADEYLDNNIFQALFDGLNPIYVNLNIDLVLQSLK
jgi:hypothetical protein